MRTLLGGLALCPCGNVVTGMPSHTGQHIYRCAPATRNRAYPGPHVARQAAPVEEFHHRCQLTASGTRVRARPGRDARTAGSAGK